MIRWRCNSCNKVWIYPIKKCFYCKGIIERTKTNPKKIIGFTKVNVPSPLHPIVPYNIILLEDDQGNRLPRKTMKEYRVGEEFTEKKAETSNAVSITKTKYDVYDAVKNSLELINFELPQSKKVLIKPNIEISAYPYQAICTNPAVIDALIQLLLDKGAKKEDISVAEQSVFGADTIKSAAKSGILAVCKKHAVNFIDLSKTEFEERTIENYKFRISKEVLNKDLIINVPVLKTHSTLGISGALENMTRVVDMQTQKEMSKSDHDEKIAYLNKEIKHLTVADGTIGLQGTGPFQTGEPSFLNLILASRDPVALDTIFSELGMFDIPEYVKTASKIGVGNSSLKEIEVVGYELEAVKLELKKPNSSLSPDPQVEVIDGRSWQGEYYALYSLLNMLRDLQIKKATIAIGSALNEKTLPKERLIAFGNQAIERLKQIGIEPMAKIEGDPPDLVESYVLLKKLLSKDGDVKLNMFDIAKSKIKSRINNIGG